MVVRIARPLAVLLLFCSATLSLLPGRALGQTSGSQPPPNILFIILDDVGIDQLATFNPAAAPTAGLTPTLDAIAAAGVSFTNFYAMPECSPSRVSFFTGRYPLRTGVTAAILDLDLPAAQISPYETTTPRVLATAGYSSALIGKYHLGGPDNNPAGNDAPIAEGWDYFNGNLRGGPPSIDTTLGGQYTQDTTRYSCGFPVGKKRGAYWFKASGSEAARCSDNGGKGYTGQQGIELGGIAALDAAGEFAASCDDAAGPPSFGMPNGYYRWPWGYDSTDGVQTQQSDRYMTTAQTDAAIKWIQRRQGSGRPWMASVSYNSIHTPYQQPPRSLYPNDFTWPEGVSEDCNDPQAQRVLSNLMLAAMDREIGRLLAEVGLAQQRPDGTIVYRPEATDTMVVVAGDNGTFLSSVRPPYDPLRAKGTPYETGVAAPLMAAGPLVESPGRSVDAQVNAVDLFELFGEIAGVDVRDVVPAEHTLDSAPMLGYLTEPGQTPVRMTNFTMLGDGLKPPSVQLWPCVIAVGPAAIVTDILFTSQELCETEAGGIWYGPTATEPDPRYPTSCAVSNAGLYDNLQIVPARVWALRNDRYKLVKIDRPSCQASLGEYEFYDLASRPRANPAGLDLAPLNLLTDGQPAGLTPQQMSNFDSLTAELEALLASEPACNGDGNLDKRVDQDDLRGVRDHWGQPSVFDFNADGVTDRLDLQCAQANLGRDCLAQGPGKKCQ